MLEQTQADSAISAPYHIMSCISIGLSASTELTSHRVLRGLQVCPAGTRLAALLALLLSK
jgi:hypothetical protein